MEVPAGAGADLDPQAAMRQLAAQLAEACRQAPDNAILARELRLTLLCLAPGRADAEQEQWQQLMQELSRPYPGDTDDAS
ncbi:MAG TPA: hypothetical protein VGF32_31025 [Streptosporangiaceae bacterium]